MNRLKAGQGVSSFSVHVLHSLYSCRDFCERIPPKFWRRGQKVGADPAGNLKSRKIKKPSTKSKKEGKLLVSSITTFSKETDRYEKWVENLLSPDVAAAEVSKKRGA